MCFMFACLCSYFSCGLGTVMVSFISWQEKLFILVCECVDHEFVLFSLLGLCTQIESETHNL